MHAYRTRRLSCQLVFVLAMLTAPGARAEITPEARQVLDRYMEAAGGRAAFQSMRSMHLRARLSALGMVGTTQAWSVAPDRRATETLLGPFKIDEGFDGRVGWRTDPSSGKPIELDGKDLEDAQASAYYDNELWLSPDQGRGKVTVAGTERDSLGVYTVIEVTPPIGRPRRFYLDQKTGLIDRASTKKDQLEVVSRFSDYRAAAGGRKVSFRQVTQVIGMPANDLVVEIDSVWVNETIPDSRFAFPGAATAEVQYLRTPGRAVLPFRYSGRHVWLSVAINGGEPADFLFDTGASITVLDSAFAAKIGLTTEGKLQGQGAGALGMASFSKLRSARVAGPDGDGVEVHDQKVAVLSLNSFLAPFFWRDCAGVLGYDFITRFVTEVDFDRQKLTLHDPKTFEYKGSGTSIPFTLAGTVPVVRMKLDGRYEGDFRVDVGSSSTVDLHTPFVRKHGLESKVAGGIEVTGGGFGGTFTSRLVRMKTLSLGPYTWKRPLVSMSGAQSGAFASEDYAGNIGNQILQRFTCTFDYERRVLHLQPGAKFDEPDRFSRAGVQLARYGDVVKAMQVLPRSPAAKAGLSQGDEIVSVDGKPVLSYSPDDLNEIFEKGENGRAVVFEVARGDKREKIEVRLREIL